MKVHVAAESEAGERRPKRGDTAYSPRLHEEELSATASRILLRVVELWLENRECGMVALKSFLDSTRRMLESWLERDMMVAKWLWISLVVVE